MLRYLALATDYDGTLAHDGRVSAETLDALRRLKDSGRKIILVTGRVLPELREVFPQYELFDLIVAENGGLLWNSQTRAETLLAEPPPPRFAEELRRRGALPLAEGRVIVATWQPHETTVFETIRDLGLEMQVIFNKGAVMILPSGVNKASGLQAALGVLGLSAHNAVGIGDAENDHALVKLCEAGAAVSNALPSLKESADLVTEGDHGRGVTELIEHLLRNDLSDLATRLERYDLKIGERVDGGLVHIPPYGPSLLIAGTSGGGKSTLATTLIEKLTLGGYQYCIVDPEGDYAEMENAIVLGNADRAPDTAEVLTALGQAGQNCVVNLIGLSLHERPRYFEKLFSELQQLRARTGRPHWLILDETHHIMPAQREQAGSGLPAHIPSLLLITVEPEHIAPSMLAGINLVLAIGSEPGKTLASFTGAVRESMPDVADRPLEKGAAMAWWRHPRSEPFVFRSFPPSLPRKRHSRKYAEGDVRESSFIFTGPDGKLKLRAQNLFVFLQMGEGVDDLTWNYHLHRGDYARWFRDVTKDPELAGFTAMIAGNMAASAAETREALRRKIEERYTAAA